jgi:hypothetical protein
VNNIVNYLLQFSSKNLIRRGQLAYLVQKTKLNSWSRQDSHRYRQILEMIAYQKGGCGPLAELAAGALCEFHLG